MKRIIILVVCISLIFCGIVGLDNNEAIEALIPVNVPKEESEELAITENYPLAVNFLREETFSDEKITIALEASKDGAKIYYTTDFTTPTIESKLYTKEIAVQSRSRASATTIKAIAVLDDEVSEVFTRSYVTGKGVTKRFTDDTLVFVLSTDPYNLNDYYYGIATEGYMRDEFLQSDEYNGYVDWSSPANWSLKGRESERDMYVEAFDSNGNILISQAAGAKISGGASRATRQKSWRLIARNIYSKGLFRYDFFGDNFDINGNFIDRYDRLTLRNGGNDREFGGVRDELSMELSKQADFPDTQDSRPTAVFLNGEYYGFAWLKEAFSEKYLEIMYGGVKDNYLIIENSESMSFNEGENVYDESKSNEQSVQNYWKYYSLAYEAVKGEGLEDKTKTFLNDDIFNEFCEGIDIDNYILYAAIQVYIDNKDWPNNNTKAWRYFQSDDDENLNEFQDGKWRYLMFDVEYAWSLYGNDGKLHNDDTLKNLLTGRHKEWTKESVLLQALLVRSDMQEKFANTMCDLIYGPFNEDNVIKVLNEKLKQSQKEFNYALENGYTSEWANIYSVEESRNQIIDFAKNRPNVMKKSLMNNFEIPEETEKFSVQISTPTGAKVKLNSRVYTEKSSETIRYFNIYNVPITCEPYDGYEFDYWLINGEKVTEKDYKLNVNMANSGKIEVTLKLKPAESRYPLIITEAYTSGEEDWIEIYNPNSEKATTKGLYLTDDPLNLQRYELPTAKIEPHSCLIVTMKNNKSSDTLKKLQTNFSLKSGETLILSDKDGNIISSVYIYETDSDKSLTRNWDGRYTAKSLTQGEYVN